VVIKKPLHSGKLAVDDYFFLRITPFNQEKIIQYQFACLSG